MSLLYAAYVGSQISLNNVRIGGKDGVFLVDTFAIHTSIFLRVLINGLEDGRSFIESSTGAGDGLV